MMENGLSIIKKYKLTFFLLILVIVLGVIAIDSRRKKEDIVYAESLDMIVATVEGEDITLRDFAIYVAYEEELVEEQAVVYDAKNPKSYWNIRTEGGFMTKVARDEGLSMAIHDTLFYQLYQELELVFTDEELQELQQDVDDFWSDLTDEDKDKRLGISKEDVYHSMYKIACAQNAQEIYTKMYGVKYEDFDYYKEEFLEFLKDYEYQVDDNVLNQLHFGNITLVH